MFEVVSNYNSSEQPYSLKLVMKEVLSSIALNPASVCEKRKKVLPSAKLEKYQCVNCAVMTF